MLFSEGECWVLSAGPHIITTTSSQNKAKSSRARILKTLITFNLCYDWPRLGRLKGELIAVCIYDTSLPASCGEESGNIRSRWELNIPHTFPLWPQGWVLRAILSVFCYGSVQLYWILRDCNKFQDLHCTEDLNWNIPKFSNVILIHSLPRQWGRDWLTYWQPPLRGSGWDKRCFRHPPGSLTQLSLTVLYSVTLQSIECI